MAHRLLLAFAAFCLCMSVFAEPLKAHIGKNRVILTFSASSDIPDRLSLIKQIEQYQCQFSDRDLVHIDLIAGSNDYRVLSQRFSVPSGEFRLVLVGKDGELKLSTDEPLLESVFALIDAMPMRHREQRGGKCQFGG